MSGAALHPAGTIRAVKLKCGRANCRCRSGNDEDKHGPYYFWNRKVKGKMTSSSIPPDKVSQVKKWIQNRHRLEKLIGRLLTQGHREAVTELGK